MYSTPTTKWPVLTVRLPPEISRALKDYARDKQMTASDAVRLILAKHIGGDPLQVEAVVQANARSNAYVRVRKILDEALMRFKNEAP